MSAFKAVILRLIVLCSMTSFVFAETEHTRISATVFTDIRYDDNASRTPEEIAAEPLSERQIFYGVSVVGDYTDPRSRIFFDYTAREENYLEDSQSKETIVFGKSILSLKNTINSIGIDMEHNQTRLLNDPTDVELTTNTSSQSLLTARPYMDILRAHNHVITLAGIYAKVSSDSDMRESYVETGAELTYSKKLSAIRTIGIRGQSSEYDFVDRADIDYRQDEFSAFFRTELRQFEYAVDLGSRAVILEESDRRDVSPFYRLTLDYVLAGSKIGVLSESEIANTSSFQTVQQIDSGIAVGTVSDEADRVDVKNNQFSLVRDHVFGGRLAILYSIRDIEYTTLEGFDTQISLSQLRFTYPASHHSDLGVDVSSRKVTFDSNDSKNFLDRSLRVQYRHRFPRRLSTTASYQIRHQTRGDSEINASLFVLNLSYLLD